MKKEQKIEILAPAGSYECFHAAIQAGADAVYAAGARFGARAYADNFSQDELLRAIREAHLHDRRFYLTVNTLLKDEELADYLAPLYACGLDAVIVQDIGVFSFIRQHFPEMDLHASTQMTLTNSLGAKFLEQEGAARIVPSRELSLNEIRKIHQDTNLEILCAWCTLLLLLRPVPSQQHDWWKEWQQRAVCPALQTSLYSRWKAEILSESERHLYP